MLLEINSITCCYGEIPALNNVTLSVGEGELVAVIGSNGAGKTTLIRTISGALHPKTGTIKFLGKNIEKLPSHRISKMGVSHIPEGRGLFPLMTVIENLELGAFNVKSKRELRERLDWIFSIFPVLQDRRDQLAGTLSGGEQQMLAIGRGLISKPKLLMLDEPSLGLMPLIVHKVFSIIKELKKDMVTMLLVEQNVNYSLNLADRAYVFENGEIVLEGEGKKLLSNTLVKKAYLGL